MDGHDAFFAKKKDRTASNAALTGAGAATATTGFVAGGLPGVKGDASQLNTLRAETPKRKKAVAGVKAGKGGLLGWRVSNHQGGTYGFKQKATLGEWYPSHKASEAFKQGRYRGKVAPEETIIRHLKTGKKAAGAAMAAGAGAVAYGQRDKIHKRKSDRDKLSGAAVGVGGTGLAVSGAGAAGLSHQGRRWDREYKATRGAAAKLVPALAGKSDQGIIRSPEVFRGVKPETARQAGVLRGAAAQQQHFAHVYHDTSRILRRGRGPSAVVAGAGGVGLAASHRDKVKKSSPLLSNTEIRQRKRKQAHISQTTGALGAAAVGTTLAGTKKLNPKILTGLKAVGVKNPAKYASREKIKDATTPILATSGGLGAVGSFNFARYTAAESRKKNPVAKRSPFEDGYYGVVAKAFDSERDRMKRADRYETASVVGAGAGGALTAQQGWKTAGNLKRVKSHEVTAATTKGGRYVAGSRTFKAIPVEPLKAAARGGKRTAAVAGATGAAVYANRKIKQKKEGSWSPSIAKSAFGVTHD